MKALWIRVDNRTVTEVDYEGLPDLQRMVGGNIELAMRWTGGDVLFVNDEGLFKYRQFFTLPNGHQPFAGNGVIVGRERAGSARTWNPKSTLADVTANVRFFNHFEISKEIGHS